METLHLVGGKTSKTRQTLSAKRKPPRTRKLLLAWWLTLAKGKNRHLKPNFRVDVLKTQTNDPDELSQAINNAKISNKFRINQFFVDGVADFITGLKVAMLSLKHRQDKSQH